MKKVPHIPFLWKSNRKALHFHKVNALTFTIRSDSPIPNMLYALTDIKVRPFAPKHFLKKLHIKYNKNAESEALENDFRSWTERFNSYFNPVWESTMNHPDLPTLNSHILAEVPDIERRVFTANPYFYALDTKGQQLPYIFKHTEYFSYDIETINKRIASGIIDEKAQALNYSDYDFYKDNEDKGNYRTFSFDGGSSQSIMYAFNASHKNPERRKIFSDVRFRIAMSVSLNREEMSELVYKGATIPQQAGPNIQASFMHPDFATKYVDYNPEAAEKTSG